MHVYAVLLSATKILIVLKHVLKHFVELKPRMGIKLHLDPTILKLLLQHLTDSGQWNRCQQCAFKIGL